jgi:glycosyltransferase involved in cell wall biosynthesis
VWRIRNSLVASTLRPEGPHVLHVIAAAHHGGAESVVRGLALASAGAGYRATIAVLIQAAGSHPFADRLRADRLDVAEIRCGRRRYLSEVRVLADLIARTSTDLVHTHVYHADIVGYLAARRSGRPVIATVHGFTGGGAKNRLYQWLDLQVLRRCDRVICVSAGIRSSVVAAGCREERVRIVPNGHVPSAPCSREDARHTLGLPPAGLAVGWVGRLSREKGPDLFLDALEAAPTPALAAALVGDGAERARLAARLPPGGATRLVGEVADAARLLPAFDALVISSRTEGLPMILLEAMAAGVPIVSFAVGGIPEVVTERCAWLVAPGDVAALSGALHAALGSPEERGRRARLARKVLEERFAPQQWVRRVRAVYDEVLSR